MKGEKTRSRENECASQFTMVGLKDCSFKTEVSSILGQFYWKSLTVLRNTTEFDCNRSTN